MNYFFKGLRDNSRFFWVIMIWGGAAALAGVDIISTIAGSSPFKLKAFFGFIIANVIGVVLLAVYKGVSEKQDRNRKKDQEDYAAAYEPGQIEKIKKLAEDPNFDTLCYECVHFEPNLLHCTRNIKDETLKQVRINERKYCVYWVAAKPNNVSENESLD